ncbi:hypothetical protein TNCV_1235151 [Trichonephila clavipes]|nr:hypothetical protein TNCV_1235151 [Trichonephila clavipes]
MSECDYTNERKNFLRNRTSHAEAYSMLYPPLGKDKDYLRAFGDRPRSFEPWASDENDACISPLFNTASLQWTDVRALDRFKVNRSPTQQVFRGTRFELMTCCSRESITLTTATSFWRECSGIT